MSERRLLTEADALEYVAMGRTNGREWLRKIGADRHFGRSLRYDLSTIDRALDAMECDRQRAQGKGA